MMYHTWGNKKLGGWRQGGGSHAWDDQHNVGLEKLSKMMYHTWGNKKLGWWWWVGGGNHAWDDQHNDMLKEL